MNNKLIVKQASKEDNGRGIVRIDPELMSNINLKMGDVIEISLNKTRKKTVAILYPGIIEDKGTRIIRLDPSLGRNISVVLDDIVEIKKIVPALAIKITFTELKNKLRKNRGKRVGLEENVILNSRKRIDRFISQFPKKINGRIFTKGDIISMYAYGYKIDLMVIAFDPNTVAVRINLDTKIVLSE